MLWRNLRKTLLFSTLLLFASNCIEQYGIPALSVDYNYLVVEGFLISSDSTIIKLRRTSTLAPELKATAELNAIVQIQEEGGTTYTLKGDDKGAYKLPPLQLNDDKRYRLYIRTNTNKEYASDYVPFKRSPKVDEVTWQQDGKSIQFYINTRDPENKTWYYLWTFEETWQYSSAFRSPYVLENGEVRSRTNEEEVYLCWRTVPSPDVFITSTQTLSQDVVNQYPLFSIANDSRKLYYGYSLLIQQHAITKEAYEYWSALLKNNEQMGSLFDAMPSQDIGNQHCITNSREPVLGYFSASSITRKRVLIDRQDITGPSTLYQPTGYEYCDKTLVPLDQLNLTLGNQLLIEKKYDEKTGLLIGYLVGTIDCADCRAHGGTINKPDYWNR